jgi:signal transduction histidine kinase
MLSAISGFKALRRWLPKGRRVSDDAWRMRHRQLVIALWGSVPTVPLFGLLVGWPVLHSFQDTLPIALCAALASVSRLGRRVQTILVAAGLSGTAIAMVHLGNGQTEMHFAFFVAVALLALYSEWLPLLVALGVVLVHHVFLGLLLPEQVFDHAEAYADPLKWALIHTVFVVAAAQASLGAWRINEMITASAQGDLRRALTLEQEASAELRRLHAARGNFVSSVSHELRTPLTSILGYVELLADGDAGELTPVQERAVDVIDRNARRLRGLIEDLLAVSQELEVSGELNRPIDLAGLVRYLLDRPESRAMVQASGVGVSLDADTADGSIEGDPELMRRLLCGLLNNAVKFTPAGGSVSVRIARQGDRVTVEITDTGIGIPAAEQGMLFSQFFRSSLSVKGEYQGAGLGLAVAKRIVDLHDGTIGIVSAEGEGTTVTVTLPAAALPAVGRTRPAAKIITADAA